MFEKQIGIDLGTVNVLVHVKGRGIVLHEPSVVAIRREANKMVLIGHEAYDTLGRTPESIEVVRPMRDGVIADFVVTEAMLRKFIQDIVGRFPLFKPKVMISTPRGVTSVEERAVHDRGHAGRRRRGLSDPRTAGGPPTARGFRLARQRAIWWWTWAGGTTEAAIVSMYDIVVWSSVRVGGNRMDESIVSYIRKKYNLLVGDQTAEEIKIAIGSAMPTEEDRGIEVRGRDQINGLPKTIEISNSEVIEAMMEPLQSIVRTVRATLEKAPPELAADIIDRGMVITGGSAQLRLNRFALYAGNRRAGLCRRESDGLCGIGRGPSAGKLRNYAAQPADDLLLIRL